MDTAGAALLVQTRTIKDVAPAGAVVATRPVVAYCELGLPKLAWSARTRAHAPARKVLRERRQCPILPRRVCYAALLAIMSRSARLGVRCLCARVAPVFGEVSRAASQRSISERS